MVKGTYTASTNFRQSKGEPMKDKLGRNTVCLPIKEVVASQRQDRKSVVTNFKSKCMLLTCLKGSIAKFNNNTGQVLYI